MANVLALKEDLKSSPQERQEKKSSKNFSQNLTDERRMTQFRDASVDKSFTKD